MNKNGPFVVIEDDIDDQQILTEVIEELGYANQLKFFNNGAVALEYLQQEDVKPFIILSDINMPQMSGFQLRKKIFSDPDLREKCIPFLFLTTASHKEAVTDAYADSAQGFFIKPPSYQEMKRVLSNIIEYWKDCLAPNKY